MFVSYYGQDLVDICYLLVKLLHNADADNNKNCNNMLLTCCLYCKQCPMIDCYLYCKVIIAKITNKMKVYFRHKSYRQ